MTRRAFIGLLTAIGVLPKQAPAPEFTPKAEVVDYLETYYCWADVTHDGLFITGGTKLRISDPQTGKSIIFDSYRMADIPKLCDAVRAMRPNV